MKLEEKFKRKSIIFICGIQDHSCEKSYIFKFFSYILVSVSCLPLENHRPLVWNVLVSDEQKHLRLATTGLN